MSTRRTDVNCILRGDGCHLPFPLLRWWVIWSRRTAKQELIPARRQHPYRMGPLCFWGLVASALTPTRVVGCSSYDNLLRELGFPGHLALRPYSLSIAWLASYRLFGIPRPERGTVMVFYQDL